ncbi:MAG TPA: FkbM family methyltransferase [Chthoniobacteraceae bacterium]|nr:FkbM family methyltransferase [Chthoniobacteraceae bacterium]
MSKLRLLNYWFKKAFACFFILSFPDALRYFCHVLFGSQGILKVTIPGLTHPIALRAPSSDLFVLSQVFDDKQYQFATTRDPEIIVDAGANIGLTSIYLSNRFPSAKIYAIEPAEDNIRIAKENVAPYPNIILLQKALWKTSGPLNLCNPAGENWTYCVDHDSTSSKQNGSETVCGITLDELMETYHLERIDVLKMDIESAEKEVFEDPVRWIGKVDAIVIELHERALPGCNRVFYNQTNDFEREWQEGELTYVVRKGSCLQ